MERNPTMPLQLVFQVRPISKWGLGFIGPINSPSSIGYIFLIATDYCTWWTEGETFRNCTTKVITNFLEEHIVTRFGMQFFLVCDNGSYFASIFLTRWKLETQVIIKFSSNYYPKGNGVVDYINKSLVTVIKCAFTENPKDLYTQLKYALWIDTVRIKKSFRNILVSTSLWPRTNIPAKSQYSSFEIHERIR